MPPAKYVVRGEVMRVSDSIRVTVHATDTETNTIIWRDSHQGAANDLFDRQHEITTRLVSAIGLQLLDAEVARYEYLDPEDLDAWQQALRGEWFCYRRTASDNAEGRRLLEIALRRNQRLPLAWYSLALSHQQDLLNQWSTDPRQSLQSLNEVCTQFNRLYPSESWSHVVTAYLEVYLGQRESASERLVAALDQDPNVCLAYSLYGQTLAMGNKPEEALEQLETALRLSPRDTERWSIYAGISLSHFVAERYEESVAVAERASRLRPQVGFLYGTMASSHGLLGNGPEARRALEKMQASGMTVKGLDSVMASTDPAIVKRYLEGLQRAGAPSA